ncbi:hypothetical protein DID88_008264 [Monilinia fructigena]|uniref:Uncharacterized protein n=1 Tax=Monilinia fructigena TaxID=38457 RepID=A0A395J9W4_9HELO|nr:hypothetical protein DID88_008264 [Monilinia fructigena]
MFKDLPSSSQDVALPKSTLALPDNELPPIPELSSDATIPASEFNQEAEDEEDHAPPSSPHPIITANWSDAFFSSRSTTCPETKSHATSCSTLSIFIAH